jgi:hypothetical protein
MTCNMPQGAIRQYTKCSSANVVLIRVLLIKVIPATQARHHLWYGSAPQGSAEQGRLRKKNLLPRADYSMHEYVYRCFSITCTVTLPKSLLDRHLIFCHCWQYGTPQLGNDKDTDS